MFEEKKTQYIASGVIMEETVTYNKLSLKFSGIKITGKEDSTTNCQEIIWKFTQRF